MSLTWAIPRRNFAELPIDSDVRELDGRGSQRGELREGHQGGNRQRWFTWDRRDDDERVKRTPSQALAKDPCEVDDGHLRSEPREAEGNPQRERRHEDVRDTDGTGSVHPADVAAGNDADLGAEIQRAQLWVSARAEGGGCGASRARVCDEGPGLGGRSRYHGVLRSRQLGHACVRAAR